MVERRPTRRWPLRARHAGNASSLAPRKRSRSRAPRRECPRTRAIRFRTSQRLPRRAKAAIFAQARQSLSCSSSPRTGGKEKDRCWNKLRALKGVMTAVEKQFGKGAVMTLGDDEDPEPVAVIPTGSLALDLATGIGGYPRGRVVEIYGPESSGKTTLALHAIAEAQKAGGVCAFIDAEHALDVAYARSIGVATDKLLVSQPDTGEQALDITEMLVRSGAVDLVVIDSVAALTPKAELEGEMGDAHMGLQARLMSQALRK